RVVAVRPATASRGRHGNGTQRRILRADDHGAAARPAVRQLRLLRRVLPESAALVLAPRRPCAGRGVLGVDASCADGRVTPDAARERLRPRVRAFEVSWELSPSTNFGVRGAAAGPPDGDAPRLVCAAR